MSIVTFNTLYFTVTGITMQSLKWAILNKMTTDYNIKISRKPSNLNNIITYDQTRCLSQGVSNKLLCFFECHGSFSKQLHNVLFLNRTKTLGGGEALLPPQKIA